MMENKKYVPYQKIPGVNGQKDPSLKLNAIGLPVDMTGMSFLDVGCAEGFFCMEAIRRGAREVMGVDINSEMIKIAKRISEKEEFKPNFIIKDLFDIENQFDIVLFLAVLHHQKDPIRALKKLYNLTKSLMIAEVIFHKTTHYRKNKFFSTKQWFLDTMLEVGWNFVQEVGENFWRSEKRLIFHCKKI